MKLKNFVGNEKVVEQLGALLVSGRFPHALLIEGEQGIGKKTLARQLASALVCRGEDKPCGDCSQCRKAMQGYHPDIAVFQPDEKSNIFRVDAVRQIIEDAYMKPNEAEHKVYILAGADRMNESAQNALLKILEEPPEYVVFILTAVSKSVMLSTILSRSVVVSLEGVSADDGARYICSIDEEIDYSTAKKTLELFGGNIGRATDSLKDSKTSELVKSCDDICRALVEDSEFSLLVSCGAFQKDKQGIIFACDMLKGIFRDALFAGEEVDCLSAQQESVRLVKSKLSRQALVRLTYTCDEIKKEASMNANNTLLITKFCYKLREAIGR